MSGTTASLRDRQAAWFRSAFEEFERSLNGETGRPFHQRRREAIAAFADSGFPTTHEEEWRFTDLTPLAGIRFALPAPGVGELPEGLGIPSGLPKGIVLINGGFSPAHSRLPQLPPGCRIESLAQVLARTPGDVEDHFSRTAIQGENPFAALGTAFTRDGLFVSIPPNTVVTEPIVILTAAAGQTSPALLHPRLFVSVGDNSQVSLIQIFAGAPGQQSLTNALCDIVIGDGAVVTYDKIQNEPPEMYHIATIRSRQGRSSTFASTSVTLGGALTRNTITAVLDGDGAEATLNGLYLGTGGRLIDNHTAIDHAKPHCNSYELYKGILAGRSRGVFNGKIFVRKDAQKTDAKQTNKNLILSDDAAIDTKPQLEIYANDVKCTHGATIGQLEEESLFYLRTRGINADDARDLLIYAFASDVIDRIPHPGLRAGLQSMIHDALQKER